MQSEPRSAEKVIKIVHRKDVPANNESGKEQTLPSALGSISIRRFSQNTNEENESRDAIQKDLKRNRLSVEQAND